jgi:hypothetical protein
MIESKAEREAEPIWGAEAIGNVIGKNRRQTFWLLQNGLLPARKVGSLWVSERQALLNFITTPTSLMAA